MLPCQQNVPHHAIPAFPSNDAHRHQFHLRLPLHHLLVDSSYSDAMAADLLICVGMLAELSWFLLLCRKLASMEARLQRPCRDDDNSQICRLIRQMGHFLGDTLFAAAAPAPERLSDRDVTYSCHDK